MIFLLTLIVSEQGGVSPTDMSREVCLAKERKPPTGSGLVRKPFEGWDCFVTANSFFV
jgi:hypothetical protein